MMLPDFGRGDLQPQAAFLEWETLNWVTWFNQQRLLEPIGNIPPAEFEALYEQSQAQPRKAA